MACLDIHGDSLLSAATFSTTLQDTGLETSVFLPVTGSIAAFSSFSSQSTSGAGCGTWDLRLDDLSSSQQIQRYLKGDFDLGLCGAVALFENVPPGHHTIRLRHATSDPPKTLVTRNANIVAFSLLTSSGARFNSGVSSLGPAGATTTSPSLTDVTGLGTTVTLDMPSRIYVSAALNAESVDGAAKTGTWDLQVDGVTVGHDSNRYLSGANDLGAVLLDGLSGELPAGTHVVTARHATDSGEIRTMNATLLAVALSDDGGGGVTLPVSQVVVDEMTSTAATVLTEIIPSLTSLLLDGPSSIFLAASFNVQSGGGPGPRIIELDALMDGAPVTEEIDRYLSGIDDRGAGGLFGLSALLAAGAHSAVMRQDTHDSLEPVETGHIALVLMSGCTVEAIPTPTPIACDGAVLSLGAKVVSPGQELKFFGCIPAFGNQRVDIYLVVFSPAGAAYSALYPNGVAPGIHPYVRGIVNPSTCQCRDLLSHVVCANTQTGNWDAVLAVLPAGAPATVANIITYAQQTVMVTL